MIGGEDIRGVNELREKIEAVRAELNTLAKQVGAMEKEVYLKSQELDELLNKYNRALKEGE
ncbi:hypothetical protein BSK66_25090 [Paenibacillus odorifer]|uniref:aspartyl-phosphate phosphatase Spo0E family protein n=1 Tax=Paenibacillus TaxID=44249 RepID=UPI0003E2A92D|nr:MULTISPECIES: aspartyl-phosphate phosphatase Spo0E family protein [Paenibacillus]ETT54334.1 hypothetical protein C171_20444 [Paenibacillus sp. FSL H8-237]OME50739.1 hypothetical protein BSK66_25090 [Paenibacillus odorifer]